MKRCGQRFRSCNIAQAGFSLLETLIIVVIISLFLTAFLRNMKTEDIAQKQQASYMELNDFEYALKQYVAKYGAYPLPAAPGLDTSNPNVFMPVTGADIPASSTCSTNTSPASAPTGVICRCESNVTTREYYIGSTKYTAAVDPVTKLNATLNCNHSNRHVYIGTLPVSALGYPKEKGLDKYGHKYTYIISRNQTAPLTYKPTISTTWADGGGAITIRDQGGNNIQSYISYAIIAHGANGNGSYDKNGKVSAVSCSNLSLENLNCIFSSSRSGVQGYIRGIFEDIPGMAGTKGKRNVTNEGGVNATDFDDRIVYDMVGNQNVWSIKDTDSVFFTNRKKVLIGTAAAPLTALQIAKGNLKADKIVAPTYCKTGAATESEFASWVKTVSIACLTPAEMMVNADIDIAGKNSPYYCGSETLMNNVISTEGAAGAKKVSCAPQSTLMYKPTGASIIPACPNGIKRMKEDGTAECM